MTLTAREGPVPGIWQYNLNDGTDNRAGRGRIAGKTQPPRRPALRRRRLRPPSDEVLDAWCEACNLDRELFGRWAAFARRTDGPIPSWFESWLEAERAAHTLRLWSPILVPGLFQTAEYARALFIAAAEDAERAEEMVTARLDRQASLDRLGPPHLIAVLDEAVLHRLIGTPAIMHDQLTHLAAVSERPNISVEVVPASTGANAGLGGGFQLASCDGAPGHPEHERRRRRDLRGPVAAAPSHSSL